MKAVKPDDRLRAVAAFVRPGARVADVGTDHAYLPIYLIEEGIAVAAIATDINEGPLARAKAHVAAANLTDRVVTRLADGLSGIADFAPTDVMICGMGGELIARIVTESDYVKNPAVRLILQPMTSIGDLRRSLSAGGFLIEDESLTACDGKIYSVLCVRYSGVPYTLSPIACALGEANIARRGDTFEALLKNEIKRQKKRCEGLRAGARPDAAEEELLTELEKLL